MKFGACFGFSLVLLLLPVVSATSGWMEIPDWVINHQDASLSYYSDKSFTDMIGGQQMYADNASTKPTQAPKVRATEINNLLEEGNQYLEKGSYQDALDAYDSVIDIDSTSFWGNYGRGKALEGLGKQANALDAYKNAIEYNSRSSSPVWKAYGAEGLILLQMERYLSASDALNHAIQLAHSVSSTGDDATELAKIFKGDGDALTQLGKDEDAAKAYKKAEELDPSV